MIRIRMDIKQYSPFLRTMSGVLFVEHVDFRELSAAAQIKVLLTCNFSIKKGSKGFSHFDGVDHDLFEVFKPQIDVMLDSYRAGMSLAPHNHSWVQDSNDVPLNDWLKEKGINREITYKYPYERS